MFDERSRVQGSGLEFQVVIFQLALAATDLACGPPSMPVAIPMGCMHDSRSCRTQDRTQKYITRRTSAVMRSCWTGAAPKATSQGGPRLHNSAVVVAVVAAQETSLLALTYYGLRRLL
jgi:hypothetical protein